MFDTKRILVVGMLLGALTSACHKKGGDPVTPIDTTHVDTARAAVCLQTRLLWDSLPLVLNNIDNPYPAADGSSVVLTKVKFFLSNPVLIDSAGRRDSLAAWYHIVNLANPLGWTADLPKASAGRYQALELMVGVDSLRNVSGALTGALSVDSGMFWGWNTGYVFSQIEGLTGRGNQDLFAWHVGGFKKPYANQRIIRLPLNNVRLVKDDRLNLILRFNLATVFAGPMRLRDWPVIPDETHSGPIADQWGQAFTIDSVWVDRP